MQKYNPWITRGIRISCYNKRTLYLSCRNSNEKNLNIDTKDTLRYYQMS
jgi:hypothetical protein